MLSVNCATGTQMSMMICPSFFLPYLSFVPLHSFSTITLGATNNSHEYTTWLDGVNILRDKYAVTEQRLDRDAGVRINQWPRPRLKSRAEKLCGKKEVCIFFRESRLRQREPPRRESCLSPSRYHCRWRPSMYVCVLSNPLIANGICAPDFEGRSGNAPSVGQRNDLF